MSGSQATRGFDAEFVQIEATAVQQLPDPGLTARKIHIGLDPHPAIGLPATFANALFYPVIEGGVAFFHPQIKLGLTRSEDIVRVPIHEGEGGGECPAALSNRLSNGPQPRQIEMSLPHRAHEQ